MFLGIAHAMLIYCGIISTIHYGALSWRYDGHVVYVLGKQIDPIICIDLTLNLDMTNTLIVVALIFMSIFGFNFLSFICIRKHKKLNDDVRT